MIDETYPQSIHRYTCYFNEYAPQVEALRLTQQTYVCWSNTSSPAIDAHHRTLNRYPVQLNGYSCGVKAGASALNTDATQVEVHTSCEEADASIENGYASGDDTSLVSGQLYAVSVQRDARSPSVYACAVHAGTDMIHPPALVAHGYRLYGDTSFLSLLRYPRKLDTHTV